MNRSALLLALVLPLTLAACGEPEDTHPGQPVAHRRAAFNQLVKAFEPMGVMLREKEYKPEEFRKLAAKLDAVKESPWAFFLPDTNYPPTKATDKVWSQPEQFEAARQKFLMAEGKLMEAASGTDGAKVKAAYEELHDACRSCHKEFKK